MTELNEVRRPAVNVELKYVRNLGNYESIHVMIGVTDFARQTESVSQATDRVYSFVENKLIEKMKEIEDELKG